MSIQVGDPVKCKKQFGGFVEGEVLEIWENLYLVNTGKLDQTFPKNKVKKIQE